MLSFIITNTVLSFYRILIKPRRNYTTTEKALLAIVECLKQFRGIIFGCVINLFLYHNNMLYAATLSEYQRVMLWRLIIKEFGPNIQHIAGVYNIVSDTISRFPSMSSDKYDPCTSKAQCRANDIFALGRVEKK